MHKSIKTELLAVQENYSVLCDAFKTSSRRMMNCYFLRERVVSKEFMRKYIHVAKAISPVLTQEAANHIAEEYTRLRNQDQQGVDIARVRSTRAVCS